MHDMGAKIVRVEQELDMSDDEFGVTVKFQNDDEGFFGRECPDEKCLGYFKIELGTGLSGDDLPCHCPYCGHIGTHDTFWTQDQLELTKSAAMREVQKYLNKEMPKIFKSPPKRKGDLISISWEYKPGRPIPLHRYSEKELETIIVCSECGLRYAVYGVFGFCPDCGTHNSLQIFHTNLDLAEKEIELAALQEGALHDQLIADALENGVSSFDAFGRELLRLNAEKADKDISKISCQNIERLNDRLNQIFGIDMKAMLNNGEWQLLTVGFQKRHIITHKSGVVDRNYVEATHSSTALINHKVQLTSDEVSEVLFILRKLGTSLSGAFG
jgi:hypothetical protein